VSVQSILRLVYWTLWFALVPVLLAGTTVWLLSPADASAAIGPLGFIQSVVADQPVPVAIVLFTVFAMILWSQRHVLPLASYVGVAGRRDIPAALRKRFEQASALLEEAGRIQRRFQRDIDRMVPEAERASLQERLSHLKDTMDAKPIVGEQLDGALDAAEEAVQATLARWRKGELREYGESIAIAIVVALLLRAFVVEAFKIPSRSMVPTLAVGDHIFVNKFAFGPMIPGTHTRLFSRLPPARGEVIVFQFPEHPEQDFIKRVIGIPGDRIEAIDGRPRINGWLAPRCKVGEFAYDEGDGSFVRHSVGDLYVEYLGKQAYLTFFDRSVMVGGEPARCAKDTDCSAGQGCADGLCGEYQGPYTVQPEEAFMMGDNRMNSHDSRGWFEGRGGGVPFSYIRGAALWVWMSFTQTGTPAWDRIGVSVMGTPRLPKEYDVKLRPRIVQCMRERPPIEATTPPPPLH